MKTFEVVISVEKVITKIVSAESEQAALEIAKEITMTSREDFAQILDATATEIRKTEGAQ